jgi:peptidoglycan hydrolase CwlO-like protein
MIVLRREMPDSRGARKEIEQEMIRKAGKEMRKEIENLKKEIDKTKKEINSEFKKLKKELYELKKEGTKYRIAQSATRKKR